MASHAAGGDRARVFGELTQEELDRAYDQRVWAPNATQVIAGYAAASARVRERRRRLDALAYGPSPEETLDVFPSAPGSPVHVFVHGGAWRGGSKDDYSFPAETFVPAGCHFVPLNFAHLPAVRLPDMVEQVRRALGWVYRNAQRFGGDPERISLSGHSSGAHLAACTLTTDWPARDLPHAIVKSALLVGGMYDLRAPLLSARSAYVEVTPAEQDALSPARHAPRILCPVVVAVGERESPEFRRQAAELADALVAAGRRVQLAVAPDLNHFEVLATLETPDGWLGRLALRTAGLAAL